MYRLSQVARKLNVGRTTIIDFLSDKGFEVDSSPNSKITEEQFGMLSKEFADSALDKEEASGLTIGSKHGDKLVIKTTPDGQVKENKDEERILIKDNVAAPIAEKEEAVEAKAEEPEKQAEAPETDRVQLDSEKLSGPKVVGKIDLDSVGKPKKKEEPKPTKEDKPEPVAEEKPPVEVKEEPKPEKEEEKPVAVKEEPKKEEEPISIEKETTKEPVKEEKVEEKAPQEKVKVEEKPEEKVEEKKETEVVKAKADSLKGLTVLGKIELPKEKKPKPIASSDENKERKKRPRIRIGTQNGGG